MSGRFRVDASEAPEYREFGMMPPVGPNTALLLDIDGTLLDLARSPERVVVPGALVCALERLERDLSGALAFVSGRALDNIDRLFAPLKPAAIGVHGGEIRSAGGRVTRARPMPASVREVFVRLSHDAPGLLLEDKGVGLALHYRLAPEAKPALMAAMAENAALFENEKVNIQYGKAVIDARPVGVDKGTAVRRLMRQKPFARRTILFGGDDTTDLDVFRILPQLGGRGFSVGRRLPGAEHVFSSPRLVRQWLIRLAEMGVDAS
jgi:trehalose 6-phosphate phosphatase